MSYSVLIRRKSDGVLREHFEDGDWVDEDGASDFQWLDNTCDCQLHRYFQEAGEEPRTEIDCASDGYEIVSFTLPGGQFRPGENG